MKMEIFINDKPVPFELEGEKNAYEIVNAIKAYVNNLENQHFITNIIINDKEFIQNDEKSLKQIPVDTIHQLKISTTDVYGLTALSINHIFNFLELLKNIIENNKFDNDFKKMDISIDWMKEGVNQIAKIFDANEKYIRTDKQSFFENSDKLYLAIKEIKKKNTLDELEKNLVMKYIMNLNDSMQNIKKWLLESYRLPDSDFILNKLNTLTSEIDKILPQLQNVVILFQTGEDKESMNIIQKLADILENSIGLFILFKESLNLHMDKYTIKEVQFEEFFKSVTDNLKELMDAMQNNDSVMIGDLLEYEFVPNVEEIRDILLKIKNEVFVKVN
jgi:hypothetical protein